MIRTQQHRRLTLITLIAAIFAISALAVGRFAFATTSAPGNNPLGGLARPVVGMAATGSGNGYWLVTADGGIFTYGDAPYLGGANNPPLRQLVVGIERTPSGNGYWLVTADGAVFTFGDAPYLGGANGFRLRNAVVGMAATTTGRGYWISTADGGVFTFGDARFMGGANNPPLSQLVVGVEATPSGNGYWLVTADGAIFTYGDAPYLGGANGTYRDHRIIGMAASTSGRGYWLSGSNGTIYTYGDAPSFGTGLGCMPGETVAIASRNNTYWVTGSAGQTVAFSINQTPQCPTAPVVPTPGGTPGTDREGRIAAEMFDRLNAERAARGLHPLRWDDQLAGRALDWSVEMKQSAGFRHSDLHPLLGRFHIAAENIGTGPAGVTSGSMHVAWMKSTTHRVNLLAPNLEVVGIGVYCAPDGTMWATQNFGRFPGSSLPWDFGPTPPQNPIVRNDSGGTGCR